MALEVLEKQFYHSANELGSILKDKAMPAYVPEAKGIAWMPINKTERIVGSIIVGSIITEQESCPCVYVNVWLLDEKGDIVSYYSGESRFRCYAEVEFLHEGLIYRAEYMEDALIPDSLVQKPSFTLPKSGVLPVELFIDDRCKLIQ